VSAPALKLWKASFTPDLTDPRADAPLPVQFADLAHELWQRATVATAVNLKGGPAAREIAMRSGEAEALRQQVTKFRNQLERESIAFGELRAQSLRHYAIARATLARIDELTTADGSTDRTGALITGTLIANTLAGAVGRSLGDIATLASRERLDVQKVVCHRA
jgi:hypothetical protein